MCVRDGRLYSWGSNNNGFLMLNNRTSKSSPTQVGALTNWASAEISGELSVAIKTDGTIWGAGENFYKTLDTSGLKRSSPVQLNSKTDWTQATCNQYSMLAIDSSNRLWGWGANYHGVLGQNNRTMYSSPVQVGALTDWAQVSMEYISVVTGAGAVKTDGTLWTWGRLRRGSGGHGDSVERSSPTQVGALTNWAYVSVGYDFMLAAKTDGTLWAWGHGDGYKTGLGTTTDYSSPVQVGSATGWVLAAAGYEQGLAAG
jgi:alpha-tubulin suppressor-like RCC1 family protein